MPTLPPLSRTAHRPVTAALIVSLAVIAMLVGIAHHARPGVHAPRQVAIARPASAPPPVEPLRFKPVPASDARAINAAIPVVADAGPVARPFRRPLVAVDFSRAEDCLAAAAFFEAGDHADDERAVMQVVLNRVHHPAFPKTVCGVVFQGAERRTGCQFTFACDGAMGRRAPSAAAWSRAEEIAAAALGGAVFAPVGLATHYHADWMVPYWSASLDKVAQIGSHIFYRWAGWWGSPSAFRGVESGPEPAVGQLAAIAGAQGGDAGPVQFADGTVAVHGSVRPMLSTPGDPDLFLIRLTGNAGSYPARAQQLCAGHDHCTVLGWTRPGLVARSLPLSPGEMDALAFRYVADAGAGGVSIRWDCGHAPRPDPAECLRPTLLPRASPAGVPYLAATPVHTPAG